MAFALMGQIADTVNVGSSANDGTGDPLRTAFLKLNANDLYLDSMKMDTVNPVFSGTLTVGSAELAEAELEILDGATTTTAQLNYLNAATGTTGTTSTNLVFSTSPVLTTPNLGTPSAVTLTNGTGLPISTGVSGLGANVATFLATPSSSNLAGAVTDETGSGVLVFGTEPTFTTDITIGSAEINETELEILDGATVTTTELNYVSGVTSAIQTQLDGKTDDTDFSSGNSLVWLLSDTITLGTTGFVDSCNTDWVYPILEMNTGSDSIYATGLVARCLGTDVDVTFSVYADSTLNDATPSDTLYNAWQLTDESGAAVVQSSLTDSIISLDKVIWMEFTTVTTEPTSFMLSVMGRRYNRTY